MNRLTRIGVIAAVLTGSAIAFSQAPPGGAPNPEAAARSAIETRQAVFKLIGNAIATIAIAKWEGALDEDRLKRVLDGDTAVAAKV